MGHWERDLGGGDVPGGWFWHEGPETCEGRLMRSRMESLLPAAWCVCVCVCLSVPVPVPMPVPTPMPVPVPVLVMRFTVDKRMRAGWGICNGVSSATLSALVGRLSSPILAAAANGCPVQFRPGNQMGSGHGRDAHGLGGDRATALQRGRPGF